MSDGLPEDFARRVLLAAGLERRRRARRRAGLALAACAAAALLAVRVWPPRLAAAAPAPDLLALSEEVSLLEGPSSNDDLGGDEDDARQADPGDLFLPTAGELASNEGER